MNTQEPTVASIWAIAADRLKERNEQCFGQWFQPIVPVRLDDSGALVLGVSDEFFAEWLADNYSDFLESALTDIAGIDYNYSFEAGHRPLPVDPVVRPAPAAVVPAPAKPAAGRVSLIKHTFENFVVCEENRYAHMAVKSAVESPGLYNPLYIYGGSGVGKTHLLQAAAHEATESRRMRVRYVSCGELLDEFYSLLQNQRSLGEFRSSVRDVDMLLVDDVHVLANKPQMQEEFFKLFNILYGQHKQIILTSDKQPCEIKGLEPRLVTRFESGVTTEAGVPEVEGRLTILRMMREDTLIKVKLADSVLVFLAEQISSSVRRLKGCFMRLASYASMMGCGALTVSQAEELLSAQLSQESASRTVTIEEIQRRVAEQFGLKLSDILGTKRPKNIAEPRLIAMYLSRRLTAHSLPEIGAAFGKTHATILNAMSKVPELCGKDEGTRRAVDQLERQLRQKK